MTDAERLEAYRAECERLRSLNGRLRKVVTGAKALIHGEHVTWHRKARTALGEPQRASVVSGR